MMTPGTKLARAVFASALVAAMTTLAPCLTPLGAQDRLLPARSGSVGFIVEQWSFGSGLRQPTIDGSGTVELRNAAAWTVPMAASLGFGERWILDASAAYSSGTVKLRTADPSLGTDQYSLSGFSDVRARLSARLAGDNVVATIGANLPTGITELDPEQYAALRVLAAPALAMQTPALGTGFGGTAGLVFSRQFGGWAWALGASYELRRGYTPIAFATSTSAPDVDPGDALHLSVGADGFVGPSGMTVAFSTDFFSEDQFEPALPTGTTETSAVSTRLGPIFTADVQLRVAAPRLRELTVYLIDRYRSPYERNGRRVDESSGNYADAGVRAVFPLSPATGVLSILSLRHQTGLKSDSTLATAATAGAGLTLGLLRAFGGGYSLQPYVRADYGRIKSVDATASATGLSAGIALGRRF